MTNAASPLLAALMASVVRPGQWTGPVMIALAAAARRGRSLPGAARRQRDADAFRALRLPMKAGKLVFTVSAAVLAAVVVDLIVLALLA
jgi:hypothetical protein